MYLPVKPHSTRLVISITLGLMLFLSRTALAETMVAVTQPLAQMYSGVCSGEIRPDHVVIVGGVSAQSLKPALAKAQLDKQIDAMRQYVAGEKGSLVLFEVLRAAQTVSRTVSSENNAALPFILVQTLEAKFPVTANVDPILERLLQLGLDRFGKQVNVEASSYGRSVMVYYRFSDLRAQLDRLHSACKQQLVEQWCQLSSARTDSAACKTTENRDLWFETANVTLQSNPVLRDQGGRAPFYLSYPWQATQLSQIEMMGNLPLSLSGPMTIRTPEKQP